MPPAPHRQTIKTCRRFITAASAITALITADAEAPSTISFVTRQFLSARQRAVIRVECG